MGYCIELVDHRFKIEKNNIDKAFATLKDFMKTQTRLAWVTPSIVVNSDDVFEAFDEIRYPLAENNNGDYILDYFNGEKLGDDEKILNSFAKYVVPGSYFEFSGEDGNLFRFVFDGEKCETKYPKVIWD